MKSKAGASLLIVASLFTISSCDGGGSASDSASAGPVACERVGATGPELAVEGLLKAAADGDLTEACPFIRSGWTITRPTLEAFAAPLGDDAGPLSVDVVDQLGDRYDLAVSSASVEPFAVAVDQVGDAFFVIAGDPPPQTFAPGDTSSDRMPD